MSEVRYDEDTGLAFADCSACRFNRKKALHRANRRKFEAISAGILLCLVIAGVCIWRALG